MKKFTLLALVGLLFSWYLEENLIGLVTQKLNDFNKTNPCSEIHLVLNQNKFVPGDTIFFNAYLVSEDLFPIKGRRVLSLELLNHELQQERIINFEVTDGKGHNQIVVPSSAAAGRYQLVVRSLLSDQTNLVDLFSAEVIIVEKNSFAPFVKKSGNSILIFPEGGNIVGNVENNIIVKSDFRGPHQIKNEKDEVITNFSIGETGYAKVSFTPSSNGTYHVEVDGQAKKFNTEKAKEEGCALQLRVYKEGPVVVRLSVPSKQRKQQEFYAVVVGRRKIGFSSVFNFDDTNASQILIPRENLPDGLNQLTVFDKAGNILANRIFFIN